MTAPSLYTVLSPYRELLRSAFGHFLATHQCINAYRVFLFNTFVYVRETVPTLSSVAKACPNHPLRERLLQKVKQENGHELLFLDDLSKSGESMGLPVSPFVRQFVHIARQTTTLDDPISALYGDMLIMECDAPSPTAAKNLLEHFKVGVDMGQGILCHAADDEEHRRSIFSDLSSGLLSEEQVLSRAITVSRIFTQHWDWMASSGWRT